MKKKRLGEVLRERGQISPADLGKAIEDQQGKLAHLGELLLERKLVSRQDLAAALTEVMRVPYEDCGKRRIDREVLKLAPAALARRCCALPVEIQGAKLVVVMAEPQNLRLIDELRFSVGMEVGARLGFRDEIEAAIEKWYGKAEESKTAEKENAVAPSDHARAEFVGSNLPHREAEAAVDLEADLLQKSTPAVRLVASILSAGANRRASDIHFEPQASDTVVRFRVDGMLRDYQRIPRTMQSPVISRIKILADMDIAERHAPQEGRFIVKVSGRRIELRAATVAAQQGESLVLRLLEADAALQNYASLGMPSKMAESLQRMLGLAQGMILVTGPARSGKSTTLYSTMNSLRRPSVNIVSVEDPVEYELTGVKQIEVNGGAGLSFASALRSALRQDANVIMIGEIRDKETAELAFHAAQSGRLILSTLHTNDSFSAIMRLQDLGVAAADIASSLNGVIAQRLLRRLCSCHKQAPVTPEFVSQLKGVGIGDPSERESVPVGCEACDLTGYRGRVGIFELLTVNEPLRAAIHAGAPSEAIRGLARQSGMKLMQEYALDRVLEGITTLEEVQRVIPCEPIPSSVCRSCNAGVSPGFLYCPFCGARASELPPGNSRKQSLVPEGVRRA
jgi:type IV pilus assembly protein PilB